MGLLSELAKEYRTLSIVGMAKNAGKTTALNYLIEEAEDEGMRIGVTSTGRDGETVDLVTNTEKPRVYLYEDTIVSVPTMLYDLAEAGLEILEMSKQRTSIGELLLCRVARSGYVQIAGPVAAMDTKRMCGRMFELGCELVLIDGAIDRKSIAAPETSDAIILSTGAVLSRDISRVVKETAHIVGLYSLPEIGEGDDIMRVISRDDPPSHITLIKGEETEVLDLATGLGAGRRINEALDEDTDAIFIPGALTISVLSDISPEKLRRTRFVLKDPTKIFIDDVNWRKLLKRGLKVEVLKNIKVACVTVNPFSPQGYSFDSSALCSEMEKALPGIPVVDVRK